MPRIKELEVLTFAVPSISANQIDGASTTTVVRLTDEDGHIGIGECDGAPSVIKAFIEMPSSHAFWGQGIRSMLIGADPLEITALWQRIYDATAFSGRRGLGIQALSGIDIALHDLAGHQIGQPVYKLMGGARRKHLTPYATIFPGWPEGKKLSELIDGLATRCEHALKLGYRAIKICVIFGDVVTDTKLVDVLRQSRRMVGDNTPLMIDFGYRWRDWADAKWVLNRAADADLYFAEATLQHDDLEGHAKLVEHCPMRICGAELAGTRWEVREWMVTAKVAVVQPDINHCGGLTEIRRICDMAELYGVQVIPHGWKTGITAACGQHFQASCTNAPMFEYVVPEIYDLPLRRELVSPNPVVNDGNMALPTGAGLGISLNQEAVKKFQIN